MLGLARSGSRTDPTVRQLRRPYDAAPDKLFPLTGAKSQRLNVRVCLYFVAAAGLALFGRCISANAANIIVGNPLLNSSKSAVGCGNLSPEGCTFVTFALPKSAGLVQSPVDGAIVGWSVKGAWPEPGYAIRVLERRGSLEFTGARASTEVTPATLGIETFSADLPVHAGDYIGLNVPEGGTVDENKVPGAEFGFFSGLAEGLTKTTGEFPAELAYYAEVQPAPTITGVDPAAGPATGGTTVRITGSAFKNVTNVRFGTVSAASFNVESEQSLEAIAPPISSPQLVHASVTTIAGSGPPTFHDFFEYLPSPTPLGITSQCVVPEVLGRRLRAAKRRARRADCAIGSIQKLNGATARSGRIIRQRPKPGKTRQAGTTIAVTLR